MTFEENTSYVRRKVYEFASDIEQMEGLISELEDKRIEMVDQYELDQNMHLIKREFRKILEEIEYQTTRFKTLMEGKDVI